MLKDIYKEYEIDFTELSCPNRPEGWRSENSTRKRLGYFIQAGRSYATLDSTSGVDGRLGQTWEAWESPLGLGLSDESDLVMISDIDEYLLAAGKINGVSIGSATTISHADDGYRIGPIGVSFTPLKMGSQGVMVGIEDGSVRWRTKNEVMPRRSNMNQNRKTGWW